SSCGHPSCGCGLGSGWRFERRHVLGMKGDTRLAPAEMQREQHAAVARDGRAHRGQDVLDVDRVDAAGEQEALRAPARGLAAIEFELLHLYRRPLLVALDAP